MDLYYDVCRSVLLAAHLLQSRCAGWSSLRATLAPAQSCNVRAGDVEMSKLELQKCLRELHLHYKVSKCTLQTTSVLQSHDFRARAVEVYFARYTCTTKLFVQRNFTNWDLQSRASPFKPAQEGFPPKKMFRLTPTKPTFPTSSKKVRLPALGDSRKERKDEEERKGKECSHPSPHGSS